MSTQQSESLVVQRKFQSSAEQVFDAWLDPATAGKWLFAYGGHEMVRVEIDPRVGGQFRITRRDDEDVDHVGEYLEIERPHRLVFTFAVPRFSAQYTKVEVDIVALPEGCELTLTQTNVLPAYKERSTQGWAMILGGLSTHLGEG